MSVAKAKALVAYVTSRPKSYGHNPTQYFDAGWDARQVEIDELTRQLRAALAPRSFPLHTEVRSSGWHNS